jgi:hypothetical protein
MQTQKNVCMMALHLLSPSNSLSIHDSALHLLLCHLHRPLWANKHQLFLIKCCADWDPAAGSISVHAAALTASAPKEVCTVLATGGCTQPAVLVKRCSKCILLRTRRLGRCRSCCCCLGRGPVQRRPISEQQLTWIGFLVWL